MMASFADFLKGLPRPLSPVGNRRSHRIRTPRGYDDIRPRSARGFYGQAQPLDWDDAIKQARAGEYEAATTGLSALQKNAEGKLRYQEYGWVDGPYAVSSSWVRTIGYWTQRNEQGVAVSFRNGAICFYPTTNYETFIGIEEAPSKGKFVHQVLFNLPYIIIG